MLCTMHHYIARKKYGQKIVHAWRVRNNGHESGNPNLLHERTKSFKALFLPFKLKICIRRTNLLRGAPFLNLVIFFPVSYKFMVTFRRVCFYLTEKEVLLPLIGLAS